MYTRIWYTYILISCNNLFLYRFVALLLVYMYYTLLYN